MTKLRGPLLFLCLALTPTIRVLTTFGCVSAEDIQEEEAEDSHDEPEPEPEPAVYRCLRDPTWRSVNFKECQELTGWYADDEWCRLDHENTETWLGQNQDLLARCLDEALETNETFNHVDEPTVMSHYFRPGQGKS